MVLLVVTHNHVFECFDQPWVRSTHPDHLFHQFHSSRVDPPRPVQHTVVAMVTHACHTNIEHITIIRTYFLTNSHISLYALQAHLSFFSLHHRINKSQAVTLPTMLLYFGSISSGHTRISFTSKLSLLTFWTLYDSNERQICISSCFFFISFCFIYSVTCSPIDPLEPGAPTGPVSPFIPGVP